MVKKSSLAKNYNLAQNGQKDFSSLAQNGQRAFSSLAQNGQRAFSSKVTKATKKPVVLLPAILRFHIFTLFVIALYIILAT
jgi:hypothetical protein